MFSFNYTNILRSGLKVSKKKIQKIQDIKIIRTSRRTKSVSLKVRNGQLEISCPFNTSEIFLKNLIERKKIWIDKNIELSKNNQKKIDQISNGLINLKGKVLRLVYKKSKFERIVIEERNHYLLSCLRIEKNHHYVPPRSVCAGVESTYSFFT